MTTVRFQVRLPSGEIEDAHFDDSTLISDALDRLRSSLRLDQRSTFAFEDQMGNPLSASLTIGQAYIIDGQLISMVLAKKSSARRGWWFRRGAATAPPAEPVIVPAERQKDATGAQITRAVLPFYLVVDTSGSMSESISQVNDELTALWKRLRAQPSLYSVCYMSIITFDDGARLNVPLCYLGDTTHPPAHLAAVGQWTNYEAACELVRARINADLAGLSRPYRPVVYFISDGKPNKGDTAAGMSLVHAKTSFDREANPNIVTFGFGEADEAILRQMANRDAFIQESPAAKLDEAMDWILHSLIQSLGKRERSEPAGQEGELEDIYQPADIEIPGWRNTFGGPG